MTTTALPRVPRLILTTTAATHGITPAPSYVPSSTPSAGVWAAPTPEVLRALEAALTRWS